MKTIKGDLLDLAAMGCFDVIVHGCNCFNAMDGGIAAQIAKRFPEAQDADNITAEGDKYKLGKATLAPVLDENGDAFIIVNAYTQFAPGGGNAVEYDAVYEVFNTVVRNLALAGNDVRIGIPMIGAGIAGGNWDLLKLIIEDAMCEFNLTLVEYDG